MTKSCTRRPEEAATQRTRGKRGAWEATPLGSPDLEDAAPAGKTSGSRVATILKWLVTLCLCGLIIASSDWGEVARALSSTTVQAAAVAVACLIAVNIAVRALKWQALMKPLGSPFRYPDLLRRYYVGMFFANFLPSTIGGDGYRILSVHRRGVSLGHAALPVFLERVSGALTLFAIGICAGILGRGQVPSGIAGSAVAISAGGLCAIGGLFGLASVALRSLPGSYPRLAAFTDKMKAVVASAHAYRKSPLIVAAAVGLSVVFYGIMIVARYLLVIAQGADLGPIEITLAVVLSTAAAMLPISINGFGILDGTFIYLVSRFGVPHEAAVTVMLLHRTLTLGHSLLGGLLYAVERADPCRVAAVEAVAPEHETPYGSQPPSAP